MTPLATFALLQAADFATTAAFLNAGASEGNPLVSAFIGSGSLLALAAVKCATLAIAVAITEYGYHWPITTANWIYGGVIAWNLMAIYPMIGVGAVALLAHQWRLAIKRKREHARLVDAQWKRHVEGL